MSTNFRAPMAGHSAVITQLGAAIQAYSRDALLVDVASLTATPHRNFTRTRVINGDHGGAGAVEDTRGVCD